jgi:hypothetical protein
MFGRTGIRFIMRAKANQKRATAGATQQWLKQMKKMLNQSPPRAQEMTNATRI